MFKLFRKNHTTANIQLDDPNQLSILKLAATKLADEFSIDEQNAQSSIFASASQEDTLLENRAVFMAVTSDKKSQAHTMLLTFKDPILWGNARTPIDYMIVGLLPSDADESMIADLKDKVATKLHEKADILDDIRFNDNKLNKLNQSFTE